jgi:hypothetical protein
LIGGLGRGDLLVLGRVFLAMEGRIRRRASFPWRRSPIRVCRRRRCRSADDDATRLAATAATA